MNDMMKPFVKQIQSRSLISSISLPSLSLSLSLSHCDENFPDVKAKGDGLLAANVFVLEDGRTTECARARRFSNEKAKISSRHQLAMTADRF